MTQTALHPEGFRLWVQTKPADEQFQYLDLTNCAFGQYLKSLGIRNFSISGWSYKLHGYNPVEIDFPPGWSAVIAGLGAEKFPLKHGPETFGRIVELFDLFDSDLSYRELCLDYDKNR